MDSGAEAILFDEVDFEFFPFAVAQYRERQDVTHFVVQLDMDVELSSVHA